MNLILSRKLFFKDGIFSTLYSPKGLMALTLEHAYPNGLSYAPKIPNGTYRCVRGMHRLKSMTQDFETFEVTGVPNHTGLLWHRGSYNEDSEGCILVGSCLFTADLGRWMLRESASTFAVFMDQQKGVNEFSLTVCNA